MGDLSLFFQKKKGLKDKLLRSLESDKEPYEKSIEIAQLLHGISSIELLEIFRKISLHNNVVKVAQKLREKDVKTAVVTDSYQFIADDLKKRLHFDYAFANNLIIEQNIVTGRIIINNNNLKRCDTGIIYSICKGLVLDQICIRRNINSDEILAIGDGLVDIGMIKKAGLGIAYKASEDVQKNADIITNDLAVILDYI